MTGRLAAAVLLAGVGVASTACSPSSIEPGPPADALVVVDRAGSQMGWLTGTDSSGGEWVAVVRHELDRLGLLQQVVRGARVEVTLDSSIQALLEDSAKVVPDTKGRFRIVAVAIDPRTGALPAVAAGDPVADLTRFARPTGSAFKFVIATAAIDSGALPFDTLDGNVLCSLETPAGLVDFEGDPQFALAQLSAMTANSVNCAFARLYRIVGGERVLELAEEMGISDVTIDTPELATGAASVSPVEMATAMSVVLGGGQRIEPFVVERVVDKSGAVLFQHAPVKPVSVVSARVANTTAQMLTTVVTNGTARDAALADGRPAGGKTGTQDGNTDAWMVGGTPSLVVAVWMGNPTNPADGMVDVGEFGDVTRVRGGTFPAQVWKAFLDATLEGRPVEQWAVPPPRRDPMRLILPGIECPNVEVDPREVLPMVPLNTPVMPC